MGVKEPVLCVVATPARLQPPPTGLNGNVFFVVVLSHGCQWINRHVHETKRRQDTFKLPIVSYSMWMFHVKNICVLVQFCFHMPVPLFKPLLRPGLDRSHLIGKLLKGAIRDIWLIKQILLHTELQHHHVYSRW